MWTGLYKAAVQYEQNTNHHNVIMVIIKHISNLCHHDDHKVLLVNFILFERCVIVEDFS